MGRRGLRLGIRAQLTLVVLLGAILSTAATLFIANSAIQTYALQQAQAQEQGNAKIALLVLRTEYGQNISISPDDHLVVDSPAVGQDLSNATAQNDYGKVVLNDNNDYVDQVQQLIGGEVSIYQCASPDGTPTPCDRIATTFRAPNSGFTGARETGSQFLLETAIAQHMGLGPNQTPHEWSGVDTLDGKQYYTDYQPLFDPQSNVIGVLSVGVPLDTVTNFQQTTTIELLLLGLIIMIAGIIFAVLFASAIVNTLQQAARQVSAASARLNAIAGQQAGGAQQQVWAVNSINKALQNFAEMTRDVSRRTDQLSQMGNQVIQRRVEISPVQIDSILAYMTRSVRDISVASQQEAAQYERMTSAMQAVIEIAEQVAGNSDQVTESVERLDLVIAQLQQLVGVSRSKQVVDDAEAANAELEAQMNLNDMRGALSDQPRLMGARAAASSASMRNGMTGSMNMGQMGNMGAAQMRGLPPGQIGQMGQMQLGQFGGVGQGSQGNMGQMETAQSTGRLNMRGGYGVPQNQRYPMNGQQMGGQAGGMGLPPLGANQGGQGMRVGAGMGVGSSGSMNGQMGRMGPSGPIGPMGGQEPGPMGRMPFDDDGAYGHYDRPDPYDRSGYLGSGGPGGGQGMSGPSAPGGPGAPRRRMRR